MPTKYFPSLFWAHFYDKCNILVDANAMNVWKMQLWNGWKPQKILFARLCLRHAIFQSFLDFRMHALWKHKRKFSFPNLFHVERKKEKKKKQKKKYILTCKSLFAEKNMKYVDLFWLQQGFKKCLVLFFVCMWNVWRIYFNTVKYLGNVFVSIGDAIHCYSLVEILDKKNKRWSEICML